MLQAFWGVYNTMCCGALYYGHSSTLLVAAFGCGPHPDLLWGIQAARQYLQMVHIAVSKQDSDAISLDVCLSHIASATVQLRVWQCTRCFL